MEIDSLEDVGITHPELYGSQCLKLRHCIRAGKYLLAVSVFPTEVMAQINSSDLIFVEFDITVIDKSLAHQAIKRAFKLIYLPRDHGPGVLLQNLPLSFGISDSYHGYESIAVEVIWAILITLSVQIVILGMNAPPIICIAGISQPLV